MTPQIVTKSRTMVGSEDTQVTVFKGIIWHLYYYFVLLKDPI